MLTIDDGTFNKGNSFVTLIDAEDFHALRGNAEWDKATDPDKEAALVRTFDYLAVQDWTVGTFDEGIPGPIKKAQHIGALRELSERGILQPDLTKGVKSQSVEGAVEKEFFEDGEETIFTAIQNLIRPYLGNTATSQRTLVRG